VDIDNYRENCLALASKRRRLQVRLRGNVPKFLFSPLRKDSFVIGEKSNKLINLNDFMSNGNGKDINFKKGEKVIKSTAGFLKPPMPLNGLKPPVPPVRSFLKPPAPVSPRTGLKPPIAGIGSNLRGVQGRINEGKSVDIDLNSDQNSKGSDMSFKTNFDTNFEANFDTNMPETINPKFSEDVTESPVSQEFSSVIPIDTLMNLDNSSPEPGDPIHHPNILATDSVSTDNDNNDDTPVVTIKNNNDNHDNTNKDEDGNHNTSINKYSHTDNGNNHKDNNDKNKNFETPVVITKNGDDIDNYDDVNSSTDHLDVSDHENHGKENHDKEDNNNDNTEVLNSKSNDDDHGDNGIDISDDDGDSDCDHKDDNDDSNDDDDDDDSHDEDFIPPSSPRKNVSQNTSTKSTKNVFAPKSRLIGNLLKSPRRMSKVPSVVIDSDIPVASVDTGTWVEPVVPTVIVDSGAQVVTVVDSGAQVEPVVSTVIVDSGVRVDPVVSGEEGESKESVNPTGTSKKENKSSNDLQSNLALLSINERSSDSSIFTPTGPGETAVSRGLVAGIKSMNSLDSAVKNTPSINKASSFDNTSKSIAPPIETTASRRLAAAILARKKAEEKNIGGELKIPPPSTLQKKRSESKM
jgi:hypothetical protein